MGELLDFALPKGNGPTLDVNFAQISKDLKLRLWSDLHWDIAEYFLLEHRIKIDSLYVHLLEKIKNHFTEFKLATLNYDVLLFEALEKINFIGSEKQLTTLIPVCLPHGSSLIYCKTPNYKRAEGAYEFYSGQVTGHPIIINEEVNKVEIDVFKSFDQFQERRSDLFPPIMCYIEPLKRIPVGKHFIAAEQRKWREWAQHSSAIVIIGVSVNRNDKHIWEPLRKTPARILYVSGTKSKKDFEKWCLENGRTLDHATGKRWRESQADILSFLEI
jgi:hypothetical protein